MVEYTDILINSSAGKVKETVQHAFQQNKFKVQWSSLYEGKATRGKKGANIALGALAQYYEIDFKVLTAPDKTVVLRIIKSTTGLWGGALGAHKVKKQYREIVDMLSKYFSSLGTFKGIAGKK